MTAGTIMHRSHLPLKTWFMAVHIVTSHSNGISALQLQAQATRVPGLDLDASLYTLLQILSVTLFEKMPIHQALAGDENRCNASQITNQLNLFETYFPKF